MRVLENQTVYDACLLAYGTLDVLVQFLADNGLTLVSRLEAGTELIIQEDLVERVDVVAAFEAKDYSFATEIQGEQKPEGIEYWGIEFDFEVQ